MRAARLLQMLLILQNRGRQTCAKLAAELEVTRRTVMRDIDALTEAGLPIIMHRGPQGGVELGFDYRTRLTGLDSEEAEAMGLLLTLMPPELHDLGLARAATRAQTKIREAFPDQTRDRMIRTQTQFQAAPMQQKAADPRRAAIAMAVRRSGTVRLQSRSANPITIHPTALIMSPDGWAVVDALTGKQWPEADWGDIAISAHSFAPMSAGRA
jgi:predicted DNA-binding transcriptional regulator YafY